MGIMYKEQKFNIHTNQCDIKGCLRPSSVLDFFQDLAGSHAEEIGVGFKNITSLGYIWIVLYEQFEVVKRIPRVHEEVLVRTWPKPRGRLEFEREYEIRSNEGELLIKGIANWALMDMNKRCITRALDVVFQGEYYDFTNYNEKQKRKLNLEELPYDSTYIHKVELSDLDQNLHMNNAKYLDILYNMQSIDTYQPFQKIEIAFNHEARLNDEITVCHYQNEGIDCYKGFVLDTPCFEVKYN